MTPGKRRALQIASTAIILCGAIGYLLASGISGGEYYKHVEEVMANPASMQGKRLQVHGRVVKDSILRRMHGSMPEYQFRIHNQGKEIEAHYVGIVPDTFKNDAEVVCKGKLTPDNRLEISPDGVMAKCPSKYDAKKQASAR